MTPEQSLQLAKQNFQSGNALSVSQDQMPPRPDEENRAIQSAQPQQEAPGFFDNIGSAFEHASESLGASTRAALSTWTDDEDSSRYHQRKSQMAMQRAEGLGKTMGTGAHIASMGLQMAPDIGSMFIPGGIPLRMATAGTVGGLHTYGDTLVRQQSLGQEYDAGAAGEAAVNTGLTDAALSLLPIRKGGFMARQAQEIARDAASGAQGQVHSNLAVGADWDQDIGMAAAGGAAIGRSFEGLSKALNYGLNKGGEGAAERATRLSSEGIKGNEDFLRGYVDYENAKQGLRDELAAATDSSERQRLVSEIVGLDSRGSYASSSMKSLDLLQAAGVPVTPRLLNIDLTDIGRTEDFGKLYTRYGYTENDIINAGRDIDNADVTFFRDKTAQKAGETKASINTMTQKAGKKALGTAVGSFKNNIGVLDKYIRAASVDGDATTLKRLRNLRADLVTLSNHMNSYTGNKKENVSDGILLSAERAMLDASELGIYKELQGVDGKSGTFDPVVDVQAVDDMERMLTAQFPSFHMGAPDIAKEQSGSGVSTTDASLLMFAPGVFAAKKAAEGISGTVSGLRGQRKVRKLKEDVASRMEAQRVAAQKELDASRRASTQAMVKAPSQSTVDAALASASPVVAADVAAADLQADGINIGTPAQDTTMTVDTPIVAEPEIRDRSSELDQFRAGVTPSSTTPMPSKQPAARTEQPKVDMDEPITVRNRRIVEETLDELRKDLGDDVDAGDVKDYIKSVYPELRIPDSYVNKVVDQINKANEPEVEAKVDVEDKYKPSMSTRAPIDDVIDEQSFSTFDEPATRPEAAAEYIDDVVRGMDQVLVRDPRATVDSLVESAKETPIGDSLDDVALRNLAQERIQQFAKSRPEPTGSRVLDDLAAENFAVEQRAKADAEEAAFQREQEFAALKAGAAQSKADAEEGSEILDMVIGDEVDSAFKDQAPIKSQEDRDFEEFLNSPIDFVYDKTPAVSRAEPDLPEELLKEFGDDFGIVPDAEIRPDFKPEPLPMGDPKAKRDAELAEAAAKTQSETTEGVLPSYKYEPLAPVSPSKSPTNKVEVEEEVDTPYVEQDIEEEVIDSPVEVSTPESKPLPTKSPDNKSKVEEEVEVEDVEPLVVETPEEVVERVMLPTNNRIKQLEATPTAQLNMATTSELSKLRANRDKFETMVRDVHLENKVPAAQVAEVIESLGGIEKADKKEVKAIIQKQKDDAKAAGKSAVTDGVSKAEERLQKKVDKLTEQRDKIKEDFKAYKSNKAPHKRTDLTDEEKVIYRKEADDSVQEFAELNSIPENIVRQAYSAVGATRGVDIVDPVAVKVKASKLHTDALKKESDEKLKATKEKKRLDAKEEDRAYRVKIQADKTADTRAYNEAQKAETRAYNEAKAARLRAEKLSDKQSDVERAAAERARVEERQDRIRKENQDIAERTRQETRAYNQAETLRKEQRQERLTQESRDHQMKMKQIGEDNKTARTAETRAYNERIEAEKRAYNAVLEADKRSYNARLAHDKLMNSINMAEGKWLLNELSKDIAHGRKQETIASDRAYKAELADKKRAIELEDRELDAQELELKRQWDEYMANEKRKHDRAMADLKQGQHFERDAEKRRHDADKLAEKRSYEAAMDAIKLQRKLNEDVRKRILDNQTYFARKVEERMFQAGKTAENRRYNEGQKEETRRYNEAQKAEARAYSQSLKDAIKANNDKIADEKARAKEEETAYNEMLQRMSLRDGDPLPNQVRGIKQTLEQRKAEIANLESINKMIDTALTDHDFKEAQRVAEAQEAYQNLLDAEESYGKLFEMADQITTIRKDMGDEGVPDFVIDNFINKQFKHREEPYSDLNALYKKAMAAAESDRAEFNKFVDRESNISKQASEAKAEIRQEAQQETEKLVADMNASELEVFSAEVVNRIADAFKEKGAEFEALSGQLDALKAKAAEVGAKIGANKASIASAMSDAMKEVETLSKLYPNDRDLWISQETYKNVRDAITGGDPEKTWTGNAMISLRGAAYGRYGKTPEHGVLDRELISKLAEERGLPSPEFSDIKASNKTASALDDLISLEGLIIKKSGNRAAANDSNNNEPTPPNDGGNQKKKKKAATASTTSSTNSKTTTTSKAETKAEPTIKERIDAINKATDLDDPVLARDNNAPDSVSAAISARRLALRSAKIKEKNAKAQEEYVNNINSGWAAAKTKEAKKQFIRDNSPKSDRVSVSTGWMNKFPEIKKFYSENMTLAAAQRELEKKRAAEAAERSRVEEEAKAAKAAEQKLTGKPIVRERGRNVDNTNDTRRQSEAQEAAAEAAQDTQDARARRKKQAEQDARLKTSTSEENRQALADKEDKAFEDMDVGEKLEFIEKKDGILSSSKRDEWLSRRPAIKKYIEDSEGPVSPSISAGAMSDVIGGNSGVEYPTVNERIKKSWVTDAIVSDLNRAAVALVDSGKDFDYVQTYLNGAVADKSAYDKLMKMSGVSSSVKKPNEVPASEGSSNPVNPEQIFYHGTFAKFDKFRAGQMSGGLIFFSPSEETARGYISGKRKNWDNQDRANELRSLNMLNSKIMNISNLDKLKPELLRVMKNSSLSNDNQSKLESIIKDSKSSKQDITSKISEIRSELESGGHVKAVKINADNVIGSPTNPIPWDEAEKFARSGKYRRDGIDAVYVSEPDDEGGWALAVTDPSSIVNVKSK